MVDKLTQAARSWNMSRIKSVNTTPEMAVRRYLHNEGLRFRLHRRDLPGKPDLVFAGRGICVFVHGCFWHGCPKCVDGRRRVGTNAAYWSKKIAGNAERDKRQAALLSHDGWRVLTIWECETAHPGRLEKLARKIRASKLPIKGSHRR